MQWVKRDGPATHEDWLFRRNREQLDKYLSICWSELERERVENDFLEQPYVGRVVVQDFINNNIDPFINYNRLLDAISTPGCEVILITGSKRSGKTYMGFDILDGLRENWNPVWVGPPINLPKWVDYAPDLSYLSKGDIGLIDEAAVVLNSRRSTSRRSVETLDHIPTMAHAGIKTIFITQLSKRTDTAVTEWCDIHIKKKYSNAYGQRFERVNDDLFDYYFEPMSKNMNFIRSSYFTGVVFGRHLPWYDDTISKPYELFTDPKKAKDWACALVDAGMDENSIKQNMSIRGCKKPIEFWRDFVKTKSFGEKDDRAKVEAAGVNFDKLMKAGKPATGKA